MVWVRGLDLEARQWRGGDLCEGWESCPIECHNGILQGVVDEGGSQAEGGGDNIVGCFCGGTEEGGLLLQSI